MAVTREQLNDDNRYSVRGFSGIAFWFYGYPTKWEPYCYFDDDPENPFETILVESEDGEWVDDLDSNEIIMVMVGDDMKHYVDLEDIDLLSDDDFCHECGQIGCCW